MKKKYKYFTALIILVGLVMVGFFWRQAMVEPVGGVSQISTSTPMNTSSTTSQAQDSISTETYVFRGRILSVISSVQTTSSPEKQYKVQVLEQNKGDIGTSTIIVSDLNCRFAHPSYDPFNSFLYVFEVTHSSKYDWYNCSYARSYPTGGQQ